jgi:hypothetical protein
MTELEHRPRPGPARSSMILEKASESTYMVPTRPGGAPDESVTKGSWWRMTVLEEIGH